VCNKYKWHVRLVKNSAAVYSRIVHICRELIHYVGYSLNLKYMQQSLIMSVLEVRNNFIKKRNGKTSDFMSALWH